MIEKSVWRARLLDGSPAVVRPIRPEDKTLLEEHHNSLSLETLYLRFFAPGGPLTPDELRRFTEVDHRRREALVALPPEEDRILGVARYEGLPWPEEAEFAVVVRDGYQGKGLGTHLLLHLGTLARKRGFQRLRAAVLAHNVGMMQVIRNLGLPVEAHLFGGTYEVSFDVGSTRRSKKECLAISESPSTPLAGCG